jgi:ankyrin repeat protein
MKKITEITKNEENQEEIAIKLQDLCLRGDIDGIKSFIEAGAPINSIDKQGITALHSTAGAKEKKHLEVASVLISLGADINKQDHDDWTPLHCAVVVSNKTMVETLLSLGADPTIKNNQNDDALAMAKSVHDLESCSPNGYDPKDQEDIINILEKDLKERKIKKIREKMDKLKEIEL